MPGSPSVSRPFLSHSCLVSSPWWPFWWACGVVVVGGEEYVVLSHRQLSVPVKLVVIRPGVVFWCCPPGRRFRFILTMYQGT